MLTDFSNFHEATFVDYEACETPDRPPDFISRSRSAYWDLGDRVVRHSDHWGRVSRCLWLLDGFQTRLQPASGVAPYADFCRIVRLTIESHRAVLVRPNSRPSLAGQRISLVSGLPRSGGRRRRVVTIDRDTPFRLWLDDGTWIPRNSLGVAWCVGHGTDRDTSIPSGATNDDDRATDSR
ncbi:MAG: hypothetical protein AAFR96_12685 [Planctomycetota bacterium]